MEMVLNPRMVVKALFAGFIDVVVGFIINLPRGAGNFRFLKFLGWEKSRLFRNLLDWRALPRASGLVSMTWTLN